MINCKNILLNLLLKKLQLSLPEIHFKKYDLGIIISFLVITEWQLYILWTDNPFELLKSDLYIKMYW